MTGVKKRAESTKRVWGKDGYHDESSEKKEKPEMDTRDKSTQLL